MTAATSQAGMSMFAYPMGSPMKWMKLTGQARPRYPSTPRTIPQMAGTRGSATARATMAERLAPSRDIVDSRSSCRRADSVAEADASVLAGMMRRMVAKLARNLYIASMPCRSGSGEGGVWKNIQAPAATVRKRVVQAKNALRTSSALAEVIVRRPRTSGTTRVAVVTGTPWRWISGGDCRARPVSITGRSARVGPSTCARAQLRSGWVPDGRDAAGPDQRVPPGPVLPTPDAQEPGRNRR